MSSDDVNAACYSNSELSDETTTSPYSVVDLSSASQESTLPRDFDDDGRDWSETSSNENEDDSAYDNQEEEDETEGDEEEEGEEGATGRHDPFVIELNHKLYAIGQYSPSSNSFQAVIDPRLPPRARDHQRRPAPRLPRRVWLREDGDGDEPRYADDPLGKDTRRKWSKNDWLSAHFIRIWSPQNWDLHGVFFLLLLAYLHCANSLVVQYFVALVYQGSVC